MKRKQEKLHTVKKLAERLLLCACILSLLCGTLPLRFSYPAHAEEDILLYDQEDPDDPGIVLVEPDEDEPDPGPESDPDEPDPDPEPDPEEPDGEEPEEPDEDEEPLPDPEPTMNPGTGMSSYLQYQRELSFAEVSDPTADLEDAETWWRMFRDMELSGNWAEDLLRVAESQIGYTESERNFSDEDPWHPRGYTRYGAWYGLPYGDWCAMFICFCLYYAEIPDTVVPYNPYCSEWVRELRARDMYRSWDSGYRPRPGDFIFFDFDEDEKADHVGIISGIDEEKGWIHTIEGNRYDYVEPFVLNKYDYSIVGYGILPENPDYDPASPGVVRQNGVVELTPELAEPTPPQWDSVLAAASGIKNMSITPTVETSRVAY